MSEGQHWLLWDGDCGLCRNMVAWAERRDRRGLFHAVPYQRAPSPPLTPALREACRRAVHVVTTDGRVLHGGTACLFVLARIGHPRLARLLSLPPFSWAVALGYRIVVHNRELFNRLLFHSDEACTLG